MQNIIEQAVRMKEGIECLSIRQLNVLVGEFITQQVEDYKLKDAVRTVAKEEFEKKFGSTCVSWVDYAEGYSKGTGASFALEGLYTEKVNRM